MSRQRDARIGIVFWSGYIGVAPSIINATRAFAAAGVEVDIMARASHPAYASTPRFPSGVELLVLDADANGTGSAPAGAVVADPPSRRGSARLLTRVRSVASAAREFAHFVRFVRRTVQQRQYSAVIGVDMEGLVAASSAASGAVPLIYWSLEIDFASRLRNPFRRMLKQLERRAHRDVLFTVIQDRARGQALLEENGVPAHDVAVVPNAPRGPAVPGRRRLFHDRFGLAADQRVILHAGMIDESMCALPLADAAAEWPASWSLVFHERKRRDAAEPYLRNITTAGGGRVLLSLEPVPYDELDEVIGSADVGLAFYDATRGPNYAEIAAASGKLAHYLRCGVPAVCSPAPGLDELLEDYPFGVIARTPDDVKPAIARILAERETYSAHAIRCYVDRYEFDRHFHDVLARCRSAGVLPRRPDGTR